MICNQNYAGCDDIFYHDWLALAMMPSVNHLSGLTFSILPFLKLQIMYKSRVVDMYKSRVVELYKSRVVEL